MLERLHALALQHVGDRLAASYSGWSGSAVSV